MSVVAALPTYFHKSHNNHLGHALPFDQRALAKKAKQSRQDSVICASNLSISTIKRTARKRSIQERAFDLSLAKALLSSMGTHPHKLSHSLIRHEGKNRVPKGRLAHFKLTTFSIFTRKKQLVVIP